MVPIISYQSIEITWSDGTLESFAGGQADGRLVLVRGQKEFQEAEVNRIDSPELE